MSGENMRPSSEDQQCPTHEHAHEHPHGHHADPGHTHDDHLIDTDEGPIEENPLWQRDNVTLVSVGIDVGSAGTQILFSRLHLRRQAVDLSSRYLVVERETWFESPVSLTPYRSETEIDDRALGAIVDEAYRDAGIHPDAIHTGVVILTGEALRRRNSERITRILSEKCGELVCATAGHHMEALLAAHGSGAAQASHDRHERVLNVDIGGGTTKFSVLDNGKPITTAAVHIGGRLIAFSDQNIIQRLEPAGREHALRCGFDWTVGTRVTAAQLDAVADSMAADLIAVLTDPAPPRVVRQLYLTDPVAYLDEVASMVFSGGVAEFVYQRESRDFGDLGRRLGQAIRKRIDGGALPWELLLDSRGIRATALGASEYTAQLSGNTGYISNEAALLPRRNIQSLRPEFDFSTAVIDDTALSHAICDHMVRFDVANSEADLVFAFHWEGGPEFSRVSALARGIIKGLAERIARGKAIYVIVDADIAMNLGAILKEDFELPNDVLVIDGVALWDFDYIDLGTTRQPSNTVPVTIKSLVFSDVSDGIHRLEHIHHKPRDTEQSRHATTRSPR